MRSKREKWTFVCKKLSLCEIVEDAANIWKYKGNGVQDGLEMTPNISGKAEDKNQRKDLTW